MQKKYKKIWSCQKKAVPLHPLFALKMQKASPGGGIGRRVGLKHQWKEVYAMIIVPVKEGENIERAIKKFKRKFDKTGVIKELRRRQQFDKPSELKRIKMAHAKYVQSLHAHDDM